MTLAEARHALGAAADQLGRLQRRLGRSVEQLLDGRRAFGAQLELLGAAFVLHGDPDRPVLREVVDRDDPLEELLLLQAPEELAREPLPTFRAGHVRDLAHVDARPVRDVHALALDPHLDLGQLGRLRPNLALGDGGHHHRDHWRCTRCSASGTTPGEQAQIGEVLLLSQPAGEFTLPDQPQPLLLIASGSGITPMLPLLQTALRATDLPVTLMYCSRDPAFLPELEQLSQQYAHFDLQVYATAEALSALLDTACLQQRVPDIGQRLTYVCANPALMQLTRDIWQQQGWADRLIQESFLPVRIDTQASRQPVRLRRAMRDIEAQGNLLASAEASGMQPASGCRMGICNTCVCTRVSGSTRNLLTGEITSAPNQPIRLCISEAVSPVELDL